MCSRSVSSQYTEVLMQRQGKQLGTPGGQRGSSGHGMAQHGSEQHITARHGIADPQRRQTITVPQVCENLHKQFLPDDLPARPPRQQRLQCSKGGKTFSQSPSLVKACDFAQ